MGFVELSDLATKQHGLLTAAQLRAAGYSKRMVASRVHDGVMMRRATGVLQLAGSSPTWEQSVMAAVLAAQPVAAASVRSAARLWGFRSVDDEVEVSIVFPRRVVLDIAIVHRSRDLTPSDITEVDGIPTTTPDRTICDLGLVFPETEVYRILCHAIAVGLVTPHELWTMRHRTSKQGRNGTGVLQRVLEALPDGIERVESGPEALFLKLCEDAGLPRPMIQLPIRVAGRSFRLDFAWPGSKVFVEVDGAAFHSSIDQIAADGGRQNLLVQFGWRPVRFTYEDLRSRQAQVARAVRQILAV